MSLLLTNRGTVERKLGEREGVECAYSLCFGDGGRSKKLVTME